MSGQVRAVALPARAARAPKGSVRHRSSFRLRVRDRAALRRAKARAARRYRSALKRRRFPAARAAARSGDRVRPTTRVAALTGLNQPGLGALDNGAANQGSPADTTGAVGPSHYLEFVNSKVAVYDRATLSQTATRDLDAFAGATGDSVCDPQVEWDQQASRWLYAALNCGSGSGYVAFGWSKTADPSDLTSGWCRFSIPTGSFTDDYPKLGHADNHILIGTNVFLGQTFETARIWAIPKPAAGEATCTAPTVFFAGDPTGTPLTTAGGSPAETPVPANTWGASTSGYVVSADVPPGNQVMAWHIAGPATAPTIAADGEIPVPAFSVPGNVPQPGVGTVLDSLDGRLTQAVAMADPAAGGQLAVWTQHTVAAEEGRSGVRWYELVPGTASLQQSGTIQDPDHFVFNAAISPAASGSEAVAHYNVGSAALAAQVRARSRRSSTPAGRLTGETVVGASAGPDLDFSCSPCRWGDYAGASPDPADTHAVWGSNQLNGPISFPDPAWVTRNFALQPGADQPPTASLTASPNLAAAGRPVLLSGTGSSDPDGPLADYRWDLDGDGTFETDTGIQPTVSRSFATPGTATVRLRVTDATNDSAEASATVSVRGAAPDRSVVLRVNRRRAQRLLRRGLRLRARCPLEACAVTASGRVAGAGHPARLGTVRRQLAAGRRTTLVLRLSRRGRRAVLRRLARGRALTARVTVAARDAAGNRASVRRSIRIRR